MSTATAALLAGLVLLFPLAGSALCGLLGPVLGRRFVNLAGTLSIGAAFAVTLVIFALVLSAASGHQSVTATLWNWLNLGAGNLNVSVDVTVDQLSVLMLLVITGVGLLIHVYSVGYMEHDEGAARFFSYMNFFIFSMALLVLAANLVILIIGWAAVALSSYLLIGFWYERESAVLAARKAFITQVIGDVALVIAAFLIFVNLTTVPAACTPANGSVCSLILQFPQHLYTLSLPQIFANAGSLGTGTPLITLICILLAVAAFAKSAQFPLHTWLPDAMEGPTPVSALIHAATMVTAGVYLIARFHPLFDRAPIAAGMVACVGMGTAIMAGFIALSQVDIKRVIAYSTMSQIGLMIFAVGIGAYAAGMYQFLLHAFFKALLFLAAGNVIHAVHDEQDIREMGGLDSRMRVTAWSFLVGSLALAGFLFAGMFSKEDLLGFGLINGPGSPALYIVGIAVNVLTGLYAFRLYGRVFRGEPQSDAARTARESRAVMLWPVVILAGLSAVAGWALQWPVSFGPHLINAFLNPVFTSAGSGPIAKEPGTGLGLVGFFIGLACSLIGIGIALRIWVRRDLDPSRALARPGLRLLPRFSFHKLYFDELYDAVLVRPTRALARGLRRVGDPVMDSWIKGISRVATDFSSAFRSAQTGLIRDYASYMVLFVLIFTIAVMVAAGIAK
ncbi:MAG: NADH-quinone oxidoreductase subunit L [Candidatus Dormibacteria bacterium]|jgi:NADH-quinone oxidoreductase subunit L